VALRVLFPRVMRTAYAALNDRGSVPPPDAGFAYALVTISREVTP
jgi:hypothetical protein